MKRDVIKVNICDCNYFEVEFKAGKKTFLDIGGMFTKTENDEYYVHISDENSKVCKNIKKAKKFVKKEYQKRLNNL